MAPWKPCLGLSMHAQTGFVTSAKKRNKAKLVEWAQKEGKEERRMDAMKAVRRK